MARARLQYVFAALLALLSTQAVTPSQRVVAAIEFVRGTEAEQQVLQEARRVPPDQQVPRASRPYTSRTRPAPDAAVLFQRPPPGASLFS